MFKYFPLLLCFLTLSCGGLIPKEVSPRAKGAAFYDFTKDKGVIFHRRCEKMKGKRCTDTLLNLIEEWDFFYHAPMVIGPENKCLY